MKETHEAARFAAASRAYGCVLIREGSRHSVFHNPRENLTSTVPRHTEINDYLARKICRDLRIPMPD